MSSVEQHYKVGALLGKGGFARVFRATERLTGREVALKLLARPDQVSEEDWSTCLERFEREAQSLLALSSPNIAKVYDFDFDELAPYLALEFIGGESLEAVLKDRGDLPWPSAVEITGQVLQGLIHAHDAQLLHRDIKPANVMIEDALWQGQRVVLVDFGIVKASDGSERDITTANRLLGTPRYMAPEQLLGEAPDARSDLYSVGLLTYEMLTGRALVQGSEAIHIVAHHLMGDLRLDFDGVNVPDDLQRWIRAMTARDVDARPMNAREALHRLRDVSALPPEAEDAPSLDPARLMAAEKEHTARRGLPPQSRSARLFALSVGLLAMLTCAGIWWVVRQSDDPPPAPQPASTHAILPPDELKGPTQERDLEPQRAIEPLDGTRPFVAPERGEIQPQPAHQGAAPKRRKPSSASKRKASEVKSATDDQFHALELRP